ncbi:hypothetical protein, conserved [Plasmodium vivax]|uniref:VIR protein n=1 Tax=Plasmodium vivax TaxID=5855 RepID=A0A1G4H7U9_PLAVI|nr:hypothetical protein, conserved [Plasmodium vivax]
MANACDGSDHQYLSYKCYDYLSSRLDTAKLDPDNNKYLDSALESLGRGQYNKYSEHKIITNLAAHIASDGVFIHATKKRACSYINYILNKSLRNNYSHIYTEDYNIYQKFAKSFYNHRHNNNADAERSCENYIKHIDDSLYNRLKTLYKIYYHYNELKRPNNYIYSTSNEKLCDNLGLLILYSNYAIKEKIINDDTISLIKDLKEIIKNDKNEKYKTVCDLKKLNGMLTEFPKPVVQNSREQEPALDSYVAPITRKPHELELQTKDAENEEALSQIASNQDSEMELTSMNETTMEQASQELEDKDQVSGIEVKSFQAVMYPEKRQQLPYDQEVTERLGRRYILQEQRAPADGTEGLLGKMQGFFTETLGQVEPAPILGVSGGMGALFLLFKYTPFGTFFRGRGRLRRIRSGFHGQFPGGFPDINEYEGGYIGYGPMNINPLAE